MNAGGHQKLGERPGTDSPLELSEGAQPCQHPDLGLPDSKIERMSFCCPKPLSCGTLLQQP